MAPVSFRHLGTSGAHEDLELRVGAYRHLADSYYFGLDHGPGSPATIGGRLALLLDQWLRLLDGLDPGGTAHLPFDFSDQYTAWLRVTRGAGSDVRVEVGSSDVEGWSFLPGDITATAARLADFTPIPDAAASTTIDDLRAAVHRDRAAFAALP